MNSPLFITARFRSGSTMLWNLFHRLSEARAYYEPLHDHLVSYINHPIQPQLSHLFVDTYFDEFKLAPKALALHQGDFANHRLYLEENACYPEMRDYIQELINEVPPAQIPVLQFNRIDFRLPWIRKNFPDARTLHLWRNPRDQWYSTLSGHPNDIDQSIDCEVYSLATWARDLYKQFPFLAAPQLKHAYQRHYYLWKLSLLAGQRLSDWSISYEEFLLNPEDTITSLLQFADLYSEENKVTCLRLVESKPDRVWKQDHNNAWFSEMENECEAVLDELGLNQNFGLVPLAEIQARSTKYQTLLSDPRNNLWADLSFKQTVSKVAVSAFELNWNLDQAYKNAINQMDRINIELEQSKSMFNEQCHLIENLRADSARMEDELAAVLPIRDRLERELNNVRSNRDQLQEELARIHRSKSYRITAPLRAVFGAARVVRERLMALRSHPKTNNMPEAGSLVVDDVPDLFTYDQTVDQEVDSVEAK